jgi:hypothetical protein
VRGGHVWRALGLEWQGTQRNGLRPGLQSRRLQRLGRRRRHSRQARPDQSIGGRTTEAALVHSKERQPSLDRRPTELFIRPIRRSRGGPALLCQATAAHRRTLRRVQDEIHGGCPDNGCELPRAGSGSSPSRAIDGVMELTRAARLESKSSRSHHRSVVTRNRRENNYRACPYRGAALRPERIWSSISLVRVLNNIWPSRKDRVAFLMTLILAIKHRPEHVIYGYEFKQLTSQ